MKQGTLFTKVAMSILFIGVVFYLGAYIFNVAKDPFTTAYAYTATSRDSISGPGFIIREETVISNPGGIAAVVLGEGESVAVGETIANIYKDQNTIELRNEIDELNMEIRQIQSALYSASLTDAKLDQNIAQQLIEIRNTSAHQDFSNVEEEVLALKAMVLKREYTYGESAKNTDLEVKLAELRDEVAEKQNEVGIAYSIISSPVAGAYYSVTDGLEDSVSVGEVSKLMPSDVETLINKERQETTAIGKVVTAAKWYVAVSLDAENVEKIEEDGYYNISFSKDFENTIPAQVESISEAQNGKRVVILSAWRNMNEAATLRQENVNIELSAITGLKIPERSLRVDKDGQYGVYVVTGVQAEFKPVYLLGQGTGYYIVTAKDTGKSSLRVGDEVIVAAKGLFDGKIVR